MQAELGVAGAGTPADQRVALAQAPQVNSAPLTQRSPQHVQQAQHQQARAEQQVVANAMERLLGVSGVVEGISHVAGNVVETDVQRSSHWRRGA